VISKFTVLALLATICLAAGLGLVAWSAQMQLVSLQDTLYMWQPWLLVWRGTLLATLLLAWPALVRALSATFKLHGAATQALHAWRWRAGLGLVLMDLILVEDLLQPLGRIAG